MRLCECGHEQQSHVANAGECVAKDCSCAEYEEAYNDDAEAHNADPFDGASGDGSLIGPDIGG